MEDEKAAKEDEVTWPPPQPRSVDTKHIELRERHGRVYLRYQLSPTQGRRSAADFDDENDDDSESDSSVEGLNNSIQYTELELSALLANNPDILKHCIVNIESSYSICAKPSDHSFAKILISTRKLCGRAFHGDEVLVEIFDFGKKLDLPKSIVGCVVDKSASNKSVAQLEGPWAKVVGIFKRAVDPKYRMFVCHVEEGNTGVLVPLSCSIPKIFNLERQLTEDGKVTVYGFTKAKQVIFDHYQKVHDVNSVLFVVRYLKWEDHCSLPLGIVVSVLPPGVTVETAKDILDIEYSVPRKFCEATLSEVRLGHSAELCQLTPNLLAQRYDYRDKLVFTIALHNSRDLDNALSFEVLPGGTTYVIGVHVADVSYFVTKCSAVDSEARQRGSAFYTALGDSTALLPTQLADEFCTLLPGADRLTLSVYIKVNAGADILGVDIKRSVVRSHYRLSYSEAESIINGIVADESQYSPELMFAIVSLSRVAQLWRTKRLGREALYAAVSYSMLDGPKAHKLVDEMMLAADHQVAVYLLSKFPSCTALQCQSPPHVSELENWKTRHLTAAHESVVLSRPYCDAGDICQCRDLCQCLPALDAQYPAAAAAGVGDGFELMLSLWPQIQHAFHDFDNDRLQSLIISPEFHPRQAIAMLSYQLIEEGSVYRCSGELVTNMERHHHSLNLPAYVQFTSPLHRYLDLVTHRLVVCSLEGTGPCYSQSDITELCRHCTDVALRTRHYERANLTAHFCDLLMKRPVVLHAVVDRLTDSHFQLLFPTIQSFFPSQLTLNLSTLNTASRPVIGPESEYLLVTWSQRIYDCRDVEVFNRQYGMMEINPAQYTFMIPSSVWNELLLATVDDDLDTTTQALHLISSYMVLPQVQDPTSEGFESRDGGHFAQYSLRLYVGGVVMVQLSTELHRGLLRPCIQLLYVTPSTCVCLEHITNAVKCFCSVPTKSAARATYSSLSQYKSLWLSVLAMEAVHCAIANQHSVVICHVDINWTVRHVHGQESVYLAVLKLPVSFCEHRCINFAATEAAGDEREDVDRWSGDDCCGYMCVRYSDISVPVPSVDVPISQLVDLTEPLTWVAHCTVTAVVVDKDKQMYSIYLKVHQSSFPLPPQLLDASTEHRSATVEWIDKPLPYRSESAYISD